MLETKKKAFAVTNIRLSPQCCQSNDTVDDSLHQFILVKYVLYQWLFGVYVHRKECKKNEKQICSVWLYDIDGICADTHVHGSAAQQSWVKCHHHIKWWDALGGNQMIPRWLADHECKRCYSQWVCTMGLTALDSACEPNSEQEEVTCKSNATTITLPTNAPRVTIKRVILLWNGARWPWLKKKKVAIGGKRIFSSDARPDWLSLLFPALLAAPLSALITACDWTKTLNT